MVGIVGKKRGMTRVFTEEGQSIPVTVIEAAPNRVTQIIKMEERGYHAVQVTWGESRASHVNKPRGGLFIKANVGAGEGLIEYRLANDEKIDLALGSEIDVTIFKVGQRVDVVGKTNGKGFSGTIKRHNFNSQRMSHGNSVSHRAPGSIGQCQTPGRVFKGKKMAGQMGSKRRTAQNLTVVRVDSERNLLLVKGSVPATKGAKVIVRSAVKQR